MPEAKSFTGHDKLNNYLLRVTCVCWLAAKLIGWRMWTAYRLFPMAPVFEKSAQLPAVLHLVLFILSLLLIVSIFLFPKYKPLFWGLLAIEILSCLLDQNRLQPWEYQYIFIIFIFIVHPGKPAFTMAAFVFILACTYIYSGAGKLNEGFLQTIWAKMTLHLFLKIDMHAAMRPWPYYSGYVLGLLEMLAGTGLIFLKTRKIAAGFLIGMHLFVLLLLGPLGLRYNIIVWPWNVGLVLYLYLIFVNKGPVEIPLKFIFSGWNKLVFICWGILPAFNFVGYWDNYLSSGVYSGKLPRMLICIRDTAACKPLRRFSRKDLLNTCNGEAVIDLQYWAMSETRVAPYPEIRVYKQIQTKLQEQYPRAGLSFVYFINGKEQ